MIWPADSRAAVQGVLMVFLSQWQTNYEVVSKIFEDLDRTVFAGLKERECTSQWNELVYRRTTHALRALLVHLLH